MTDWSELVKLVLNKKDGATHQFVLQTQKNLFQFCFHLTKNQQLAEDISHDTYLKAFTSLHQLKNPELLMAWLKSIARSLFLDFIKASAQSKTHLNLEDAEFDPALKINAATNEEQMTALQVLQMLPEDDRIILILSDIQENSYEEVAQVLNIPTGTVKSRLSRARDKFAEIYNGTKVPAKSSIRKGAES